MYDRPWKLLPNPVRTPGGRELQRFRGVPDPDDLPNGAEEWVGSVTRAVGVSDENPDIGCSKVILPDGETAYLYRLIADDPEKVLGRVHLERFGTELGVLVKYLDAVNKFLLQCHPTRENARRLWNCDYGKTESWYVLGTRTDTAEPPFIWLGFKPGVTREKFEEIYRHGTLEDAEALCHKFRVSPGETWFVPGGMPHGLGPGCFVIEVQEPTDNTAVPISQQALIDFRTRCNPLGTFVRIDEEVYDRRTLESFDYTGRTADEVLAVTRSRNPVIRSGSWGEERLIIGPEQTAYFSCTELRLKGSTELPDTGEIRIGIVTRGSGALTAAGGSLKVKQGEELFLPIGAKCVAAEGDMTLVLCHPAGASIVP